MAWNLRRNSEAGLYRSGPLFPSPEYHRSLPPPQRETRLPEIPVPILFVNAQRVDIPASFPGDTPLLWILRD